MDTIKQQMAQHEIDMQYLFRLKKQEHERAGPIYEHLAAKINADCACENPLRFFSSTLRSKCVTLRMKETIKQAELLIYQRAFKAEISLKST